jgi:AraC-like DNA-binding protein
MPFSAAVIGADNNDLHCSYAATPLSSVDPDFPAIGRTAAELMTALLNGESAGRPRIIPPKGVVERLSTRRLIHADPIIDRAVRMMQEADRWPLSVDAVAEAVGTSRRTLEHRFVRHVGQSPGKFLRDYRLKVAHRLVVGSKVPLIDIAFRCGFSGSANFSRAFRAAFGTSPSECRDDAKR